jgi:hypothetical protein
MPEGSHVGSLYGPGLDISVISYLALYHLAHPTARRANWAYVAEMPGLLFLGVPTTMI